jgi:nucleotide-binding universal stress UspA family protein
MSEVSKVSPTRAPAVVVGYRGGDEGAPVLRAAATEAALRNAPLTLLHQLIGPEAPEAFGSPVDSAAERELTLQQLRREAQAAAPGSAIDIRIVTRSIAGELVAASRNAAMIVVGATVEHSMSAVLLDSVSRDVVRRAQCPTMLVPHDGAQTAGSSLVCGIDRSPASGAALRWAAAEAELRGTKVVVIEVRSAKDSHEVDDAEAHDALVGWVRRHAPRARAGIDCTVLRGNPADALLEAASARVGLLVIGSHERHPDHWSRSIQRSVTSQRDVAVVVVPHLASAEKTETLELRGGASIQAQ